jgi:hypothetical protein
MPWNDFPTNRVRGLPGAPADLNSTPEESLIALEAIAPGLGIVRMVGNSSFCRLPQANVVTLLDDAGAYTSGTIAGTVNGFAVTAAYNASKDQTLTDFATAIQALNSVLTAVYTGGTTHTIVITAVNNEALVVVTPTGMVGGMTFTSNLRSTGDTIRGLAAYSHQMERPFVGQIVNDQAVITLSGDVMAGSDTLRVMLNGTLLALITYATSELNSLTLLAEQIQAQPTIVSAVVDGTARNITVKASYGMSLVINSIAVLDNSGGTLAAAITSSSQNTAAQEVSYKATEMIPGARKGRWLVVPEQAVTPESNVFVRFADNGAFVRGGFRIDADTDRAVSWAAAHWTEVAAAGVVTAIEFNLP